MNFPNLIASLLVYGLICLLALFSEAMPLGLFIVWVLGAAFPAALFSMNWFGVFRSGVIKSPGLTNSVCLFVADVVIFFISLFFSSWVLLNLTMVRSWDWLYVGAAFPLFFLVRLLLYGLIGSQSVSSLRDFRLNFWSLFITSVFLVLIRLGFLIIFGQWSSVSSELVLAPFCFSSSNYLQWAGRWAVAASTFKQMTLTGYLIQIFSSLCLYGGLLSAVSFVSLPKSLWPKIKNPGPQTLTLAMVTPRRAVLCSLVGIFLCAVLCIPLKDRLKAHFSDEAWLGAGEILSAVRGRDARSFLLIDGRYCDLKFLAVLPLQAGLFRNMVMRDRWEIIRTVNEVFDCLEKNVDGFLDWYFENKKLFGQIMEYSAPSAQQAERFMVRKAVLELRFEEGIQKLAGVFSSFLIKTDSFYEFMNHIPPDIIAKYAIKPDKISETKRTTVNFSRIINNIKPPEIFTPEQRGQLGNISGVTKVFGDDLASQFFSLGVYNSMLRPDSSGRAARAYSRIHPGGKIITRLEDSREDKPIGRKTLKKAILKSLNLARTEVLKSLEVKT
ncbi:MAG: hypothetical protein LBP22_09005 [Deltaproteobacteria bacterium]|jgi:hypothetical protein|nr:hypothetical protein [Deltaproteobacteria bacterium]